MVTLSRGMIFQGHQGLHNYRYLVVVGLTGSAPSTGSYRNGSTW